MLWLHICSSPECEEELISGHEEAKVWRGLAFLSQPCSDAAKQAETTSRVQDTAMKTEKDKGSLEKDEDTQETRGRHTHTTHIHTYTYARAAHTHELGFFSPQSLKVHAKCNAQRFCPAALLIVTAREAKFT